MSAKEKRELLRKLLDEGGFPDWAIERGSSATTDQEFEEMSKDEIKDLATLILAKNGYGEYEKLCKNISRGTRFTYVGRVDSVH